MRQNGFLKDGKTAEAQIVPGLLVSEDGYPLSYSIFNRKQYEGYIAKTITTLWIRLPKGELHTETLYTTSQQEAIRPLIGP